MKNFPFKHEGKTYWYSRSVAGVIFAFTRNEEGELCILANKRGDGTPNHQGEWNCPCGYLDFDETIEECARRECFEETGICIPDNVKLYLFRIGDDPNDENQNISMQYACYIPNGINMLISKDNMEEDEVDDIRWIPVKDINQYVWAFNHKIRIEYCVKNQCYWGASYLGSKDDR